MKLKNILFGTLAVSVLSMGTMSCSDSFLDEEMYSLIPQHYYKIFFLST